MKALFAAILLFAVPAMAFEWPWNKVNHQQEDLDKMMEGIVIGLNAACPKMVDNVTRLDKVEYNRDGKLRYFVVYNTITLNANPTPSQLQELVVELQAEYIKDECTRDPAYRKGLKQFPNLSTSHVYTWHGKYVGRTFANDAYCTQAGY